jgi:hypothetical protein
MKSPPTNAVTAERRAEVARFLEAVTDWGTGQNDIRAIGVVGSWPRGTARMDSDVDIIVLTDAATRYMDDDLWARQLGVERVVRTQQWGVITERRFAFPSGLEVEFGIGTPAWSSVAPVDSGTAEVVSGGLHVLHDPDGLLAALLAHLDLHTTTERL